jgi:hypothetical protein
MAIDPHQAHGAAGTPNGPGYETRDASIPALLKFAVTLAIVLIVVSVGMRWLFGYFAKTQTLGPATAPFENTRTIPPVPRLQVAPQKEIHDYWESQQETLNSYGWVDKHNGTVRIPIDRAMRLVLQRGLPARPANSAKSGGAESQGGTP